MGKKQHSRDSMEKNSSNSSKESSVEKQPENNTTPEEEKLEMEVEETSIEPSTETTGNTEVPTETYPVREATPDIIRKSPVKEVKEIAIENIEDQTPKKNISAVKQQNKNKLKCE